MEEQFKKAFPTQKIREWLDTYQKIVINYVEKVQKETDNFPNKLDYTFSIIEKRMWTYLKISIGTFIFLIVSGLIFFNFKINNTLENIELQNRFLFKGDKKYWYNPNDHNYYIGTDESYKNFLKKNKK